MILIYYEDVVALTEVNDSSENTLLRIVAGLNEELVLLKLLFMFDDHDISRNF